MTDKTEVRLLNAITNTRDALQKARHANTPLPSDSLSIQRWMSAFEELLYTLDTLRAALGLSHLVSARETGAHSRPLDGIAANVTADAHAAVWDGYHRARLILEGGTDPIRYDPIILPLEAARNALALAEFAVNQEATHG